MPSVAEAVKVVSVETGEPESFVAQIARNLINSGVLPKTVGKRISEVDALHVALLLLGVFTATKFSDASERAWQYAALQWGGERDGLPFGAFLAKALTDIEKRLDRHVTINESISVPFDDLRIEVVTSYPLVIVSVAPVIGEQAFEGGINFAETPHTANYWPSSKPRRSVTIPGCALFSIVSRLFGIAMPPDEELFDRVDPAESD